MTNETTKTNEPVEQDVVLKSLIDTLTGNIPELNILSYNFGAVYFSYKGAPALRIIVLKDLSATVRTIEFIFEGSDSAKELQKIVRTSGLKRRESPDPKLFIDLRLSFISFTEREPVEMLTMDDLYKDIEEPATEEEKEEMKINRANLNI